MNRKQLLAMVDGVYNEVKKLPKEAAMLYGEIMGPFTDINKVYSLINLIRYRLDKINKVIDKIEREVR